MSQIVDIGWGGGVYKLFFLYYKSGQFPSFNFKANTPGNSIGGIRDCNPAPFLGFSKVWTRNANFFLFDFGFV